MPNRTCDSFAMALSVAKSARTQVPSAGMPICKRCSEAGGHTSARTWRAGGGRGEGVGLLYKWGAIWEYAIWEYSSSKR